MVSNSLTGKAALGLALLLLAASGAQATQKHKLHTLYSFNIAPDGQNPIGALALDSAGNLYGATLQGGTHYVGAVFKLAPDGTETILHSFAQESDGYLPEAGVVLDKSGNLYGTTNAGGASNNGTVYRIAPDGSETILYSFAGGSDGASPLGDLILDKAGNLYGTTSAGSGTVFRIAPDGTETILYRFKGGSDGSAPYAGVVMDKAGNLYGTTHSGGVSNQGTVFMLKPDGIETVLHSFAGGSDGALPFAGLVRDQSGVLYGTTYQGGNTGCGGSGCGTVFSLTPDGTYSLLHVFAGGKKDGALPVAALVRDKDGNLYGTTEKGGNITCRADGCGTVFKIDAGGKLTLLHKFKGVDGFYPYGSLLLNGQTLYGSTSGGGQHGPGTIFSIKK